MAEQDRLDRIETKLDKLTEVVVKLATIEVRQTSLNEGLKRLGTRVDDHEGRIRPLETRQASISWVERVIWVALAAGITKLFS